MVGYLEGRYLRCNGDLVGVCLGIDSFKTAGLFRALLSFSLWVSEGLGFASLAVLYNGSGRVI